MPTRERGRRRVEAILDAACELLAERGYDAATMTEVARRSRTAIGSLYRFFPDKGQLADALVARYADRLVAGLEAVAGREGDVLADALVALMRGLGTERAAVLVLLDARPGQARQGTDLRARLLATLGRILPPAHATPARAHLTLLLLKLVAGVQSEPDAAALTEELRALLGLHLAPRGPGRPG